MTKNIYEIRILVECERYVEIEAETEDEALALAQDESVDVNVCEDFHACSIDVWDVTYGEEED